MWLLADLFHDLPEVGDLDKPKLFVFFDEAHLLFNGASKDFVDAIEQTVRLIRSKGVGVFFVTQSPKDVPADVLAQLVYRVQHALRAFTPSPHRRQGAQAGRAHVPQHGVRPRGAGHPAGHRRGRRHRAVGEGGADSRGVDPDACPRVAHGAVRRVAVSQAVASSPLAAKYATALERESASEMLGKAEVARTEAEKAAALEAENAKVRQGARPPPRRSASPPRSRRPRTLRPPSGPARRGAPARGGAVGRRVRREVECFQVDAAVGRDRARARDDRRSPAPAASANPPPRPA